MKKNTLMLPFMLLVVMGLWACSNDDDNNSQQEFGEINFTVTGDFEAEKSGFADFEALSFGSGGEWSIDANDFSSQTFSLSFSNFSATNSVSRPAPGTYGIGQGSNNLDIFNVIYVHIENGDFANAVEYDTFEENAGTLTIETSNENEVKGSFSFTASKRDNDFNVTGQIQVSGSFTARPRQN